MRVVILVCLAYLLAAQNIRTHRIGLHSTKVRSAPAQFENATVLHTPSRYELATKNKTIYLLNVADVFQATDYTCGPASLTAVVNYYGVDRREAELALMAKTNEDVGTDPYEMLNTALALGFNAQMKENMPLRQLQDWIAQGVPVIVLIQAWKDDDDPTPYPSDYEDGHYVVATGYDGENIYFEDPWIIGSIGYIAKSELPGRWHGETIYPTPRHIYGCGIILQKDIIPIPTVVQLQ